MIDYVKQAFGIIGISKLVPELFVITQINGLIQIVQYQPVRSSDLTARYLFLLSYIKNTAYITFKLKREECVRAAFTGITEEMLVKQPMIILRHLTKLLFQFFHFIC